MTRIIAGTASMTRLRVPAHGTRPTSDKVREALFSGLEASFEFAAARVLDLYAGSGALGLEALSRGAESLVLVERSRQAIEALHANIAAVRQRVAAPARVAAESVQHFLRAATGEFDLVFIDPPYEFDSATISDDLALLLPLLSPDALVVVERDVRSGELQLPTGFAMWRQRHYGETVLFFLEVTAVETSQPEPACG